mmetsp:Transcript_4886/g.10352  ORF Transcript_4886/g.10352 Transcript_4886/m.10352 type:complete len:216 (-) Transcript_4886:1410-2057(-)
MSVGISSPITRLTAAFTSDLRRLILALNRLMMMSRYGSISESSTDFRQYTPCSDTASSDSTARKLSSVACASCSFFSFWSRKRSRRMEEEAVPISFRYSRIISLRSFLAEEMAATFTSPPLSSFFSLPSSPSPSPLPSTSIPSLPLSTKREGAREEAIWRNSSGFAVFNSVTLCFHHAALLFTTLGKARMKKLSVDTLNSQYRLSSFSATSSSSV